MKDKICVTIEKEIIKKVEEEAKKEDRSKSYIVNKILEEYFENERKK